MFLADTVIYSTSGKPAATLAELTGSTARQAYPAERVDLSDVVLALPPSSLAERER